MLIFSPSVSGLHSGHPPTIDCCHAAGMYLGSNRGFSVRGRIRGSIPFFLQNYPEDSLLGPGADSALADSSQSNRARRINYPKAEKSVFDAGHADFRFVGECLRLYYSIGYRDVFCVYSRTMRDFVGLIHAKFTNFAAGRTSLGTSLASQPIDFFFAIRVRPVSGQVQSFHSVAATHPSSRQDVRQCRNKSCKQESKHECVCTNCVGANRSISSRYPNV